MTRHITRITAGLAAVALTASMTACAGRPSTAAVVGSQRITVAEIEEAAEGLPDQLKQAEPAVAHPSFVLNAKMRSIAAQQVATGQGIANLRAQTEQLLAGQNISPIITSDPEARELLVQTNEVQVLAEQIGAERLTEGFAQIPVQVNPRYGITGLEQVGVAPGAPFPQLRNPSLSKPAGGAM